MLSILPALLVSAAPTYIAVCIEKSEENFPKGHANRVVLLGATSADGLAIVDPDLVAKVARGAKWFELTDKSRRVPKRRFSKARVTYAWNEPEEGDDSPPEMGADSKILVLGPCKQSGAVYATVPLEPVRATPFESKSEDRARSLRVEGVPPIDVRWTKAAGAYERVELRLGDTTVEPVEARFASLKIEWLNWFGLSGTKDRWAVVQASFLPMDDGGSPNRRVIVVRATADGRLERCGEVEVWGSGC